MQKKLMYLEIAGILFIVIMSVFMQNLLDLSGHTRRNVRFGKRQYMGNRKNLALSVSFMGGNRTFMYKNSVSQIYCRKGGFPLVFLPFIFGNLPAVFSHRCANPLSARIYRRTHLLYFSFFHIFPLDGRQQKV